VRGGELGGDWRNDAGKLWGPVGVGGGIATERLQSGPAYTV